MHSRLIHNGRLIEARRARLAAVSPAAFYGCGVFTTLAVYGGRPLLWPQHWARLADHADRAGVDRSEFAEAEVKELLARLIKANRVRDGRARLTLAARAGRGAWKLAREDERKTDLIIVTGDARAVRDEGLAITVSPYRLNTLSPLAGLKSLNYLERIIAWEEARARHFDDAVMLNERGEVVSATMANIFWVKEGRAHTPALSTGALAGTTRGAIIALAKELGVPVIEGVYKLAELGGADEIFLTSAGFGVSLATSFDYHRYTIPAGSLALRLREAFRQLTL
jgi:4-amino-4-deoxychorismate lyase